MFKRASGTKDILPQETAQWQRLEKISHQIFSLYNYHEIRTPLIEEESLFDRSLGKSTEIVRKQMFLIKKGRDSYCLRPEGTASVVRAYIENSLDKKSGFIKLYYIGPMFRAERPQRGRLRQFHHIGCEVIGSGEPEVDIEIIALADNLLSLFSVKGYRIQVNSLGCLEDKKKFIDLLRQQLKPKANKLCDDCRVRFKDNVLRVLDCKNETCREIIRTLDIQAQVSALGTQSGHLCLECKDHFERVCKGLDALRLDYKVNPYLVRGLDYYTRTVFEVTHPALGAQDAIGAGGRYDNLVEELGGPDTAAMGFAFGMERLILALDAPAEAQNKELIFIVSLGEEAKKEALLLLSQLRKEGLACDTDYENKSLKGAMRLANDSGAKRILIIGEDELKKEIVTLKDMRSGGQKEVKRQDLLAELKRGS
ncbi:MAG: histidine--tRNA ligase [Candidatus Omnitrophica bacterium]|nr:histidine--tRNA ligase [Candidatus Omnitrophota bacterium]